MFDTQQNIVRSVGKSAASGAGMSVCKTTDMHKTILEILGNYPEGMTRKSLREQMLQKGYPSYRIRRAIKTMGKDGRITLEGSNFSPNQLVRQSAGKEGDS